MSTPSILEVGLRFAARNSNLERLRLLLGCKDINPTVKDEDGRMLCGTRKSTAFQR
jgi:hypothetical protein